MKKLNKLTAVLLALVMCLSLLPMSAFAADEGTFCGKEEHEHSEECGELVCTSTAVTHSHTDSCYEYTCGKTAHTHDGACYDEKYGPEYAAHPGIDHRWTRNEYGTDNEAGEHYRFCTYDGCTAEMGREACTFDGGRCTVCKAWHNHGGLWVDGVCRVCGFKCDHFWGIEGNTQFEHVDVTCLKTGQMAYVHCNDCGGDLSLEEGSRGQRLSSTSIAKDPANHDEECELSYVDNEDGTHDYVRTCGEVVTDDEGHVDEDTDNFCDLCGADLSTEEPDHEHTYADNRDGTHSCTDPECPDSIVNESHVDADGDNVCDRCGAAIEEEIDDNDTPLDDEPEIDDTLIPLASGPITRAEFVNYLWEREDRPESDATTFLDVPEDHEYYDAIGWAQANKIAIGVDEKVNFQPDEYVTVAQVRLFLTRYAKYLGMEMPALTKLTGEDGEAVLNCGEIVAEFFGEEYTTGEPKEDAE